jgi:hypothetical protein
MHKKSQKCYVSRSRGGGTPGATLSEIWITCLYGQRHQFCQV